MKTAFETDFWLICFIWVSWKIAGTLTVDTATTEQIPKQVLESLKNADPGEIRHLLNNTRRIILGRESTSNRPYMVYLKLPSMNEKYQDYKNWLCGGVIIHPEYILTSAACIEDVKHFYVVSGTFKFSFSDDRFNNPCIKNGAKKAVWKCIPRNYVFDGHENDNIRWMNNDLAIVRLEDELDFTRRVRGCDYVPKPICYNNQSATLEEPGNIASVAGWGSTDKYNDWINSRRILDDHTSCLLESPVTIMSKLSCKKRWGSRYHNIIENYMICTNDLTSELSEICMEKYVDCQDILGESTEEGGLRRLMNPNSIAIHSAHRERHVGRRVIHALDGGFCENDHGGPLVYGEGINSVVIGIISACLVKERTNKCYGPFLYTSIYKNRVLINCALHNEAGTDCNKLFRASVTHTEVVMNWADHPDGPAKSEIKAMRRKAEEEAKVKQNLENNTSSTTVPSNAAISDDITAAPDNTTVSRNDEPIQHSGVIVRVHDEDDKFKEKVEVSINNTSRHNTTDNKTFENK